MSGHQTINSLTIATTSFIGMSGGTNISLTLQTGDVTRQDVAGTEGTHSILATTLMASDGLWNIAGAGVLSVSQLGQTGTVPINLTKTGNGLLSLRGALYNGSTTVNQGTLELEVSSFGSDPATSSFSIASGAALQLDGVSSSAPITLTGGGISFTGALRGVGADSTLSGPITLVFAAGSDPIINMEGSSSTLMLSGGITDGASSAGLAKIGAGTLVLSSAGTFDNPVIVSQGKLVASHSMALGTNTTRVMTGATLELQNNVTIDRTLLLSGMGHSGRGALYSSSDSNTWSGLVTLQADSEIEVANNSTLALTGGIGVGGFSLRKAGAGTLVLSGVNSATGGLTVADGVLRVTTSTALPAGTTAILDRTTLELQNNVTINRMLHLGDTTFGGATLYSFIRR